MSIFLSEGSRSMSLIGMRTPAIARFTIQVVLIALSLVVLAVGQTESAIYTFAPGDSFWPQGGLVEDGQGNMYGATAGGGISGMGTVFELSPPSQVGSGWKKQTLWSFSSYGSGGSVPSTDLVIDGGGTLYGATQSGGDPRCGCGVVYKLTPPSVIGAPWTQQVLHAFKSGTSDGRIPIAGLALDSSGAVYGVTAQGGRWNGGVVFQLLPVAAGTWTETILHSFGSESDGRVPSGPVILDSSGALYGVTSSGGAFDAGTVYKLTPPLPGHAWSKSILLSFRATPQSPQDPVGNLVFDDQGNLYGVTNAGGGQASYGTAYQLTPGTGAWTERVLLEFSSQTGVHPTAGLTRNPKDSSLYGTTSDGNPLKNGSGTVFQLSPPATVGGEWKEQTLYQFTFFGDGGWPAGHLLLDPTGNLYGTASRGGSYGCDSDCGLVYQITPQVNVAF